MEKIIKAQPVTNYRCEVVSGSLHIRDKFLEPGEYYIITIQKKENDTINGGRISITYTGKDIYKEISS